MSLKGKAKTDKVLRGKIKDIHQIEDVEALFAEAEDLLVREKEATEEAYKAAAEANEAASLATEFSNDAKVLLLEILSNGIYESNQSENIAALKTALGAVNEYEYQPFCEIEEGEIKTGSSTLNGSPYYMANSVRSCYVGDKILLYYGYIYKFEIETRTEGMSSADFSIGIQAHNSGALELFRNGKPCWTDYSTSGGTVDIGWQDNGFEFACPETITDTTLNTNSAMTPGFAHLAFKRNSGSSMVEGDISKVIVYRKKVK